jgi:hypothetical protein
MYWLIGYGFANDETDSGFIGTKYFVPRSHLYKGGYNISLNNWFSQVGNESNNKNVISTLKTF